MSNNHQSEVLETLFVITIQHNDFCSVYMPNRVELCFKEYENAMIRQSIFILFSVENA